MMLYLGSLMGEFDASGGGEGMISICGHGGG